MKNEIMVAEFLASAPGPEPLTSIAGAVSLSNTSIWNALQVLIDAGLVTKSKCRGGAESNRNLPWLYTLAKDVDIVDVHAELGGPTQADAPFGVLGCQARDVWAFAAIVGGA